MKITRAANSRHLYNAKMSIHTIPVDPLSIDVTQQHDRYSPAQSVTVFMNTSFFISIHSHDSEIYNQQPFSMFIRIADVFLSTPNAPPCPRSIIPMTLLELF